MNDTGSSAERLAALRLRNRRLGWLLGCVALGFFVGFIVHIALLHR